jgi:hypothetical protein
VVAAAVVAARVSTCDVRTILAVVVVVWQVVLQMTLQVAQDFAKVWMLLKLRSPAFEMKHPETCVDRSLNVDVVSTKPNAFAAASHVACSAMEQ